MIDEQISLSTMISLKRAVLGIGISITIAVLSVCSRILQACFNTRFHAQ